MVARTANYYDTHDASADYLYKLLMQGEEEATMKPVTDVVTALDKAPEEPKTAKLKTAETDNLDSGGSNSNGTSDSSAPVGSVDGLGLGSLAGIAVGTTASIGAQLAGVPGPVAGFAGGIAKGLADEGLDSKDVANLGVYAGLGLLGVPGVAISLAKALDFDPIQTLDNLFGWGVTDIGRAFGPSDNKLGYSDTVVGDVGRATAATQAENEAVAAPGVPTGTYAGPKAAEDAISAIAEAMADAFAGGYEGLTTETSYGDLAGLGGSNAGGSDPGPSGTGNSGNPGEG